MAVISGIIRNHLGKLGLAPRRQEEILCELSDHLEDQAAAWEARGLAPEAAQQKAVDSVSDWPALRSEILAAETEEGNMNYRTKALWLPKSRKWGCIHFSEFVRG